MSLHILMKLHIFNTQETVVKKTITGIKSILIYSKAVYKYEKNEGSYHSGIFISFGVL